MKTQAELAHCVYLNPKFTKIRGNSRGIRVFLKGSHPLSSRYPELRSLRALPASRGLSDFPAEPGETRRKQRQGRSVRSGPLS